MGHQELGGEPSWLESAGEATHAHVVHIKHQDGHGQHLEAHFKFKTIVLYACDKSLFALRNPSHNACMGLLSYIKYVCQRVSVLQGR